MIPEFLTNEEIATMTEYSLAAHQRRQLTDMGVPFIVSRTGKPIVSREAIRSILGCKRGKISSNNFVAPNLDD